MILSMARASRESLAAMRWPNYLANAGFALFASALFFRWLPDLHSGMRAYSRRLIQDLALRSEWSRASGGAPDPADQGGEAGQGGAH